MIGLLGGCFGLEGRRIVEDQQGSSSLPRVVLPSEDGYEDHLDPPVLAMWYNPAAAEPFLDPPTTGLLFAIWSDGYVVYDQGNTPLNSLWSAAGSEEELHQGWTEPSLAAEYACPIVASFPDPLGACDFDPDVPPEMPHARHVTLLVRTADKLVTIDFFRRVNTADATYEICEEALWNHVSRILRLFPARHEPFPGDPHELMGFLGHRNGDGGSP